MKTTDLFQPYTRRGFLATGVASKPLFGSQDLLDGSDPTALSIEAASELVRKKVISPVELTRGCLQRIERLNPIVNAFITVTANAAATEAVEMEREILRRGWRGSLHGIPIALKDNIDTA